MTLRDHMPLALAYKQAKAVYDAHHNAMLDSVQRVFRVYARQKQPVSRGRAVRWDSMRVDRFSLRGKNLRIHASGGGRYGYVHNSLLVVPAAWLDLGPENLLSAVAHRIREEGKDIARRERALREKRYSEQEREDRAQLRELLAKYPDEIEGAR